jgi:pyruvate dehydrogenase E2 component (dihydrolipoamide acetyltransferase)
MPTILMPRLSDSMEEGVIVRWLVADGDEIKVGQEIAEIETDKATMEFESEDAGTIHLRAAAGDTVAVGVVIAAVGDADEPPAPAAPASEAAAGERDTPAPTAPSPRDDSPVAVAQPPAVQSGTAGRTRTDASPVARRVAAALGIDLGTLSGTGPNGRVVQADVLRASAANGADASASGSAAPLPPAATAVAAAPAAAPRDAGVGGGGERVELTRVQQLIARRMSESKATAPDFVLVVEVDMEAAVALRDQLKAMLGAEEKPPSFNDFVVKAAATALRAQPLANGSYADGYFQLHDQINVGIAVAAPDALVVPTIFDADQKSLGQIGRTSRELAQKVRDQTITPPELSGGTFSVSNLGMYGVDQFIAVLNPPQAAILAVGALAQRAVVREGELQVRHTMTLTLTCDHRILYGAVAAEFLAHIKRLLEAPGALVL